MIRYPHRPIVKPPFEVQQRAWERAYMLRHKFNDCLSLEQRVRAEVTIQTGSEHLGWSEIGDMVTLYAAIAGVRA